MRRALLFALLCVASLAAQAKKPEKAVDKRLEQLLADLADEVNHAKRYAAYNTLQRERAPGAIPALLEALPRCGVNGQELGLSLLLGYPPDVGHPALRKLLDKRWPLLEVGAAAALFRTGDTALVEHMTQPLARADLTPQQKAALVNRVSGIRDARVLAAVRGLLVTGCDGVVCDAVLNSLLYGEDAEASARVAELLNAGGLDERRRAGAAAFLLARGDARFVDALVAALQKDGANVLVQYQHFLTKAGQLPEAVLQPLREIAEKSTVGYQVQTAVRLLAAQPGGRDVPLFKKLLDRREPMIAKAALEALQKSGAGLPVDALKRLLGSEDATIALAAAESLRRADDTSGLPRVLELAKVGGNQRSEAVAVLGRFRAISAIPALIEALLDPEPPVRSAAETALRLALPNLFPYRTFDFASTGYQANGTPASRTEAVQQLKSWWEAHRPH